MLWLFFFSSYGGPCFHRALRAHLLPCRTRILLLHTFKDRPSPSTPMHLGLPLPPGPAQKPAHPLQDQPWDPLLFKCKLWFSLVKNTSCSFPCKMTEQRSYRSHKCVLAMCWGYASFIHASTCRSDKGFLHFGGKTRQFWVSFSFWIPTQEPHKEKELPLEWNVVLRM